MTETTKAWYKSKTVIGITISVIGKIAAIYLGVDLPEGDLQVATDAAVEVANSDTVAGAVSLLISFGGDLYSYYGRAVANSKLTK